MKLPVIIIIIIIIIIIFIKITFSCRVWLKCKIHTINEDVKKLK